MTDRFSFRHLGSHRSCTNLLSRSSVLRALLVLSRRHNSPHNLLFRRPQMAQIPHQVPHGTFALWRSSLHPPSNTAQLSLLGYRRICVPEVYQDKILRMVVTIELPDQLWVGLGTGIEHTLHLLCVYNGQYRSAKLVGKHHRQRDDGCAGYCCAGDRCSWRAFWPRCLVMEEWVYMLGGISLVPVLYRCRSLCVCFLVFCNFKILFHVHYFHELILAVCT